MYNTLINTMRWGRGPDSACAGAASGFGTYTLQGLERERERERDRETPVRYVLPV
jgi:hypothetical protein